MSEETQSIADNTSEEKPSLVRRIGRVIRRILLFLLLFLVFLSLAILGLMQTKTFRHWLGGQILSFVNKELEATIEFSDMGGNLLTGLTFDDVRLMTQGDTLLYARQLSVRYDLAPLLNNTIAVNRIYLDSPVIRMLRNRTDSTWNFEHIAKPSTDTTTSSPFNWTINLRNLTISNGTLLMIDSTAPTPVYAVSSEEHLNLSNMQLDSLNLSLTALAQFAKNDHALTINRITFKDHNSSFALRHLAGKVNIDTTHTEVFDMQIITNRTNLRMSAQLEDLNLLNNTDPVNWENTPVQAMLYADSVSALDLRYFMPDLDFLNGSVALDLDAEGTYGNLAIKHMEVALSNSTLSMTGSLKNLNTPEHLFIDAQLDRTSISYADIRTHLPGLDIPNLSYLGQVYIDEATFRGEPSNFESKFNISTAIGSFKGNGKLNVGADPMRYTAHLETRNLNPAAPLAMPDMAGSLNAIIDIEGRGTTLRDLNSRVRLQAFGSTIAGRSFKNLYLTATAKDRGFITADTLLVLWDTPEAGRLKNIAASSSFAGNGWINLRNPDMPVYKFEAQLDGVNLKNIAPDAEPATNITGTVQIDGRGFHPDSLEGSFRFDMQRLATPEQSIDSLEFTAILARAPDNYRDLQIASRIADISVRGNYRFTTLMDAITRQIKLVTQSIERRYQDIALTTSDSAMTMFPLVRDTTNRLPEEKLDVDFSVRVRDLSPVNLINPSALVHGDISLHGALQGTTREFDFVLDSSQIASFYYQDSGLTVSATPVQLRARINSPREENISDLDAEIYIAADSVITLNDNIFTGTLLDVGYKNDQITFTAKSDINGTIDFFTHGGGDFDISGPRYSINLDSLTIGYMKSLRWNSVGNMHIVLADNALTIDSLALQRDSSERISLRGTYNQGAFDNIQIAVESLPLSEINRFLPAGNERIESLSLLEGRLTKLGVTLNGTMENPDIELYARLDSLKYNSFPIGNQTLNLTHKDAVVTGSALVVNPLLKQDSVTLTLNIASLPLNLAFASVEDRFVSGKPIDLSLQARRLSLGLVAPFVPAIDKLQGFANAEFKVEGTTPNEVTYSGAATFFNTSFIVASTNVRYAADGEIAIKKDLITVKEINLYNDPLDLTNGRAKVYGDLAFDGLELQNLDLYLNTSGFMVMNQASKASSPTLYGDMVIATNMVPLHFYGSLESPKLSGNISILRADLIFPENRTIKRSPQRFCYKMLRHENGEVQMTVIDCPSDPTSSTTATMSADGSTSATVSPSTIASVRDSSSTTPRTEMSQDTTQQNSTMRRATKEVVRAAIMQPDESLMDKLAIDVYVDIPGRFFITMELGTLQELRAEVALANPAEPLHYIQQGSYQQLFGSLEIKPGSQLQFYRTFDATGTISFPTGEVDNPQLDISAAYKNRRLQDQKFEQYEVQINVQGTKDEPRFTITYQIAGNPATGDQAQIQADAIMLIVFGKTQSELLAGGTGGNLIGDLGQDAVTAGASALLSNILEGSGIIRTAEIDLAGGQDGSGKTVDFARSRLRISGELFSALQYRLESDADMANTNFTLDLPIGAYFNNDILRNVVLELTRSANSVNTITNQQREWEIKLGWRWSF